MNDSIFNFSEDKEFYLRCWRKTLHHFLGWSEADTLCWAARYEKELNGEGSNWPGWPFYEDGALEYIAKELVPEGFHARHPEVRDRELEELIVQVIEREPKVLDGEWYNVDDYDEAAWGRAKERFRALLRTYGEEPVGWS